MWELKDRPEFDFYLEMSKIIPEVAIDSDLMTTFKNSRYFGTWYGTIMQLGQIQDQQEFPAVHIDTAITDLQAKLEEYAHQDLAQTSMR
ncbi:MAG TPA: hypothetical protein DF610_04660 [Sphingobacterium sp.]|nr:hypothetical protein [Sphingobacterium sp.]